MKQLFNPDSPVMTALGIVTDFIVLNILFILLCLPIFTAGSAAAAMLYVMHGYYDEKTDRRIIVFFRTFRNCLKTGALISLFALLCTAVLVFDTIFLFSVAFRMQSIAFAVLFVGIVLFLSMLYWSIQALAIDNKLKFISCINQAKRYALTYIPETIFCIVIMLLPVVLFFVSGETLTRLLSVFGTIGFSTIFYVQTLVVRLRAWKMEKQVEKQE